MKKNMFRCTLLFLSIVIFLNSTIFASTLDHPIQSFEPTSLIKSDGTYWVWGGNQVAPIQIHGVEDVEKSFSSQFIRTKEKAVYYWEWNRFLGSYQTYKVNKLNNLIDLQSTWYDDLLALDKEGIVHYLSLADGLNYNQLDKIKPLTSIDNVVDMSNYDDENYEEQWVFLKNDGSVWMNKAEFPLEDFKPILFLKEILDIDKNIALKKDGTVWTWPESTINEANQDIVATPIRELTNIQTIRSFNRNTNIAIDQNAALWFWGGTVDLNEFRINTQSVPVKLTTIENVKDAFVVGTSLVVQTQDGKAYKTSIAREVMPENPVFDLLVTDVQQIKAGTRHMIIQKNDGTLWGWGFNKNAELGVGDYEWMHNSPQRMERPVSVYLNEEPIVLNSGVLIRNGQAFIPIRSIFERMGATINWDGNSKTVTISKSETNKPSINIDINYITGKILMNNQPVILSNPHFIVGSTAYLPLRFVSESLGAKVEWIHSQDKISISMQ